MTLDNDGHANPHAPRYPSDLPPRRDGTSPAAASPRKRLAMARAILSALDVAGALAVLFAVRSFARVALALARAVDANELPACDAAGAMRAAADALYGEADAGHTYRPDAPAPSDLAPALVAVWWGDTPEGAAEHIGAEHGAAAARAATAAEEAEALVMAMRAQTGGEGAGTPATAPATDAPAKHTSNRPDATAEGAEGEGANPAHVAAAGLAAPVVRAIVAGLEPDLRRPLVRALACVLAAGTGDEKVRAVDALDAMPCAASGRAILGAYCVDPDDGEPLPITTAGELVSALAAAEQPPAVHHVNDLPRGCHRVTLADGTTFLPAQPAADPAPRVVRLPLDGDGDEDTAALLRDCAAYASRHCAGDLAVAVCTAMTAPPGDETVDALAFVAADLAREFKHRGREYRASVAALFAAERHDPADVIARRRADVDRDRAELAGAAVLVGRIGRALAAAQ